MNAPTFSARTTIDLKVYRLQTRLDLLFFLSFSSLLFFSNKKEKKKKAQTTKRRSWKEAERERQESRLKKQESTFGTPKPTWSSLAVTTCNLLVDDDLACFGCVCTFARMDVCKEEEEEQEVNVEHESLEEFKGGLEGSYAELQHF